MRFRPSLAIPCLLAATLVLVAAAAEAQSIHSVTVDGSTLTAELELPLGIEADLTVSFESVIGLSSSALGLSLSEINPADTALLSRLPDLGSLPVAFPMLLEIEPPTTGPLTFTGVVEVELYTKNLHYTSGSPLRLWKASGGGSFLDITERTGSGSYRVRGTSGGFSEFLIGIEGRAPATVIEAKYDALYAALTTHTAAMPAAIAATLEAQLDDSELNGYELDDFEYAVDRLDDFLETIDENRGAAAIPDVWRASRDLDNVAGELAALARTLSYSLRTAP